MHIRHLLGAALLFFAPLAFAQGIEFTNGSWNDVLQRAKKENKPIVVDAYTTWCGPCKWMAKNTFTDAEVGAFVNKNFIAYKMDMEAGEGPEFARLHEVNAYPTILFFDAKGKAIHRGVGASDAPAFIELCTDALNPDKQLSTLRTRYLAGNREKAFLANYIDATMKAYDIDTEAFATYWVMLSPEEKLSENMLEQMMFATNGFAETSSEYYRQFQDHRTEYTEIIGEDAMADYRKQSYQQNIQRLVTETDQKTVTKSISILMRDFPEFSNEVYEFYELSKANKSEDYDKIAEAEKAYLEVTSDWEILNSRAWSYYENSDDTEELEYALKLINRSVELHAEFLNLDTQAAVLYKLKRYAKAKEVVDLALNSLDGTELESDVEVTKELKARIEAALKK